MEDFRSKIKNHKATPNDDSWERLMIKKEKKRIKKSKYILLAFFTFNLLGSTFLAYQLLNNQVDLQTNQESETKIKDQGSRIHEQTKEIPNQENTNKINLLNSQKDELKNHISSLKSSIKNLKLKNNVLSEKVIHFKNLNHQLNSQVIKQETNIQSLIKLGGQHPKTSNEFSDSRILPGIFPLYNINNTKVERYLVHLANNDSRKTPILLNTLAPRMDQSLNWYVSFGTSKKYLFLERERNFSIGLHRSMNRWFDIGLRYNYFQSEEKSEFRVSNEIRDQWLTSIASLFVRYKALKFNKFLLHIDGGVQYKFISVRERRGRLVENQLEIYSEIREWNRVTYQFGIGLMYDLNSRFNVGSYIDEDFVPHLNLNYKF